MIKLLCLLLLKSDSTQVIKIMILLHFDFDPA